jgi:hypothetical protein
LISSFVVTIACGTVERGAKCIISRVCVPIAISEEDRSMLSDLDTRTKWRNIHGMLYRR